MLRLLLALSLGLACMVSHASLVNIGVVGETVSSAGYIKLIDKKTPAIASGHINMEGIFGHHVKNFTVGDVVNRHQSIKLVDKPIFIVGADSRSKKWLLAHKLRLKKLGAIGYVVNVDSLAEYHAFSSETGAYLQPMSSDYLVKKYNIKHYPVFINNKSIEQ